MRVEGVEMRLGRVARVLVAVAGLAMASSAGLQAAGGWTLEGSVIDTGGQPLAGATVFLEGTPLETRTDADGRYHIPDVPAGRYVLVARLAGHTDRRFEVEVGAEPPAH